MSDPERPPLLPIAFEQLELILRQVDAIFEAQLRSLQRAEISSIAGLRSSPKLPEHVRGVLRAYASVLFTREADQYPISVELDRWLSELAACVTDRVMETVERVESVGGASLAYHGLTREAMRETMRGLFEGHVPHYASKRRRDAAQSPSLTAETSPPIQGEAPQSGISNRGRIDSFILKMANSGLKVKRKDIWQVAGYADRTEFERFQRGEERNKTASMNFNRILNLESADFRRLLAKLRQ